MRVARDIPALCPFHTVSIHWCPESKPGNQSPDACSRMYPLRNRSVMPIHDDINMPQSSRRLVILLGALLGTFLVVRAGMLLRPDADVFVGGYNIHHLYTGVIILTICVIPLVVGAPKPLTADLLVGGLGIGLSLALDEVVYLIATDGSNQSYLTPVSWIGGATLILLASGYAIAIARFSLGSKAPVEQR